MKRLLKKEAKDFAQYNLNLDEGMVMSMLNSVDTLLILREINVDHKLIEVHKDKISNQLHVLTADIVDMNGVYTLQNVIDKEIVEDGYQMALILKDKYGPYLSDQEIADFLNPSEQTMNY